MIELECPACQTIVVLALEDAGRTVTCAICAQPISVPRLVVPSIQPSPPQTAQTQGATESPPINLWEALVLPLHRQEAFSKIWWLALVAYVPIFNSVLFRGWRLNLVRRMGRNQAVIVPGADELGRFLADGVILALMTLLYVIPQAILLGIFALDALGLLLDAGLWLLRTLFLGDASQFPFTLFEVLRQVTVQMLVPGLYYLLVWPVYRIGMIRFAFLGKASAFFDIRENFRLTFLHLDGVMLVWFYTVLCQFVIVPFLIGFLGTLLAATVLGPFVIPSFLVPLLYWSTGYLYGQLAQRMYPDLLKKVSPNAQNSGF